MSYAAGQRYGASLTVRESSHEKIDEALVQRLWFEELYQNPLTTTDGERVQILQPGFWNHGAGPDFSRASLINGQGEREVGAVEVHLDAVDWQRHRHDADSAYENVVLHAVWKLPKGEKKFFPSTSELRSVRQAELSNQLRLPLEWLRSLFSTSVDERKVGARVGHCERELKKLKEEQLFELLEEAGWHRFRRKEEIWKARVKVMGREQALWMGLAEALGYSENKGAFRLLAQRLKIAELREMQPPARREALLFGIAGFLPDKILPKDGKGFFRKLWGQWWMDRTEWYDLVLPRKMWKFTGVRPANRPERRLAVLALLASGRHWPTFLRLAKEGAPQQLEKWFETLSHPFWDRHYTFSSAPIGTRIGLIGKNRIHSILYNVIWPIHHFKDQQLRGWFRHLQTVDSNHPTRVAALRLVAGRHIRKTLLIQEGLLQIYQDFCLQDAEKCRQCSFADWVRRWVR